MLLPLYPYQKGERRCKMKSKTWLVIGIIAVVVLVSYTAFSMTGNAVWGRHYCTSSKPCSVGMGDCDAHTDCLTNYCAPDVGTKYGKSATIDVCEEKP